MKPTVFFPLVLGFFCFILQISALSSCPYWSPLVPNGSKGYDIVSLYTCDNILYPQGNFTLGEKYSSVATVGPFISESAPTFVAVVGVNQPSSDLAVVTITPSFSNGTASQVNLVTQFNMQFIYSPSVLFADASGIPFGIVPLIYETPVYRYDYQSYPVKIASTNALLLPGSSSKYFAMFNNATNAPELLIFINGQSSQLDLWSITIDGTNVTKHTNFPVTPGPFYGAASDGNTLWAVFPYAPSNTLGVYEIDVSSATITFHINTNIPTNSLFPFYTAYGPDFYFDAVSGTLYWGGFSVGSRQNVQLFSTVLKTGKTSSSPVSPFNPTSLYLNFISQSN